MPPVLYLISIALFDFYCTLGTCPMLHLIWYLIAGCREKRRQKEARARDNAARQRAVVRERRAYNMARHTQHNVARRCQNANNCLLRRYHLDLLCTWHTAHFDHRTSNHQRFLMQNPNEFKKLLTISVHVKVLILIWLTCKIYPLIILSERGKEVVQMHILSIRASCKAC